MNKDYINSWLDIAIKDLEASNLLYKNKMYSNSFYHFQQASEKGFKAYGFMTKIYKTEKDLYKDGHYTLRAYKDTMIELQNGLGTLKKFEFNTFIGENEFEHFSKSLNSTNGFIPEKKDTVEYSTKILNEFIQLFKELEDYNYKFPENYDKSFDMKMNSFFNFLEKINPEEAENCRIEFKQLKENKEEFEEYMASIKKYFEIIMNLLPHGLILMFTNLISHNHNNTARYPEINFNPLKYYNLRKPIIKKLPEFIYHLNYSLDKLRKINNIANN